MAHKTSLVEFQQQERWAPLIFYSYVENYGSPKTDGIAWTTIRGVRHTARAAIQGARHRSYVIAEEYKRYD